MRRTLLALTLCLLLTAGCATPKSDSTPGQDAAQHPEAARPADGSPAAPTGAAPAAAAANSTVASAGLSLKVIDIDEQGNLPMGVGVDGSMYTPLLTGRGNSWFRQDINGTVMAANLTLEWTPAPASSTSLSMTFTPITVNSDGSEQYTGTQKSVAGDGPLHLNVKDLKWTDDTYTISIWWSGSPAYTPSGQDFHVSGTIAYLG